MTATNDLYWISFAGQLKKRTEADSYLTPCLLPAAIVLDAMERFRQHPRIAALANFSAIEINRSLADSVKRSVIRNFGDTGIVPILPSESAVTVHNLRGIYGEICTHFFCPPDRAVSRFVQERLGHVISVDELKRANSSATQHYFHYYLVDSNGQHLGAKGIKLGESMATEIVDDDYEDLDATPVQLELLTNPTAKKPVSKTPKKMSNPPAAVDFRESSPPQPETPTIDPQQFAALQQEVSRLWQHLNSAKLQANQAESTTVQHTSAQLTQELAAAHSHIAELEQEIATLHQANLGYQQRIEQLMNILQPSGAKSMMTKPSAKISVAPTQPPVKPLVKAKTERRKPAAIKILAAIDTIMFWNKRNDQKFAISQTLLLKATGCNMPAIRLVLKDHAEMIDRHHAKYDIQPRHQSKKLDIILAFMRQQ
jgi:hypothetical protein